MPDVKSIPSSTTAVEVDSPAQSSRLVSLDAFRGATIALMVLVNTAGDYRHVYAPLQHAEWHGWTITDVVFPSFLWIVGVAMTLSLGKRLAAGVPRRKLFLSVLRRALILYVLGLVIYGFPLYNPSTLRLLGVLQRIAICYVAAAAVYLTTGIRAQVAWIIGLLVSLLDADDTGSGSGVWPWLSRAGQKPGQLRRPDGAGRTQLCGHQDLGSRGHCQYAAVRCDCAIRSHVRPLAPHAAGSFRAHDVAVLRRQLLLALGLICDTWMPINKKLWTTSFSIFMAGLDFVMFAVFIWLVDRLGHKRPVRPFVILGMNAIAVYMASEMIDVILGSIRWGTPADLRADMDLPDVVRAARIADQCVADLSQSHMCC